MKKFGPALKVVMRKRPPIAWLRRPTGTRIKAAPISSAPIGRHGRARSGARQTHSTASGTRIRLFSRVSAKPPSRAPVPSARLRLGRCAYSPSRNNSAALKNNPSDVFCSSPS